MKYEISRRSTLGCSLILIFLISSVLSYSQTSTQKKPGPEKYQVYSAVLAHMFADGKVTFDTQSKVKRLVIRDQINTDYALSEKQENWDEVKIRLQALSDETIAGYEASRTAPAKLKRSFTLDLQYDLFRQDKYESIFGKTKHYDGTVEIWGKFYEKFPDSGGFVWLSNVGFNKARDRALVYFVHWCGPLCGSGHYVHLTKTRSEWKVEMTRIWIS